MKKDMINEPDHYKLGNFQFADLIEAVVGTMEDGILAYRVGTILKYICRAHRKNGIEDYKKARWFLERLINDKTTNLTN